MMVESLETLLQKAEVAHGHMCAGQILGVRMSLLGLKSLGIEEPLGADRKRLVSYVEIDRCATDAIAMVTGCRLGKRTLKFRDWGKMAATFVDLSSGSGVRIVALENSRDLARQLHPEVESRSQQQMLAYRELGDDQLFRLQRVRVHVDASELPDTRRTALCVPAAARESILGDSKWLLISGSALPVRTLNCATGLPSETHAKGRNTWRLEVLSRHAATGPRPRIGNSR